MSFNDSLWAGRRHTVNLHTFQTPQKVYQETKIGGHRFDHIILFDRSAWREESVRKTAVVSSKKYDDDSSRSNRMSFWNARDGKKEYNPTKIGGHPFDHVRFIGRGQPSRPTLLPQPLEVYLSKALQGFARTPRNGPNDIIVRGIPPHISAHDALDRYTCGICRMILEDPRRLLSCNHIFCRQCVLDCGLTPWRSDSLNAFGPLQDCNLCPVCGEVILSRHDTGDWQSQVPLLQAFIDREFGAPARKAPLRDQERRRLPPPATAEDSSSTSPSPKSESPALGTYGRRMFQEIFGDKKTSSADGDDQSPYTGTLAKVSVATVATAVLLPRLLSRRRNKEQLSSDRPVDEIASESSESDFVRTFEESSLATSARSSWMELRRHAARYSSLHRYEFQKFLGQGSFSIVRLMKRDGKLCTLKESLRVSEAMHEAKLLAAISSKYVVRLNDFFVEEIGGSVKSFIEQEYCDSGSLEDLVAAKGGLNEGVVVTITRQLCEGLQDVHKAHIIHCDLKPSNILLNSDGSIRIADFGVSKELVGSKQSTIHPCGTLSFMAPEVKRFLMGETVRFDFRADIWSLGAVIYSLVTGNIEPSLNNRPVAEIVEDIADIVGKESVLCQVVEGLLQSDPSRRQPLEAVSMILRQHSAAMSKL